MWFSILDQTTLPPRKFTVASVRKYQKQVHDVQCRVLSVLRTPLFAMALPLFEHVSVDSVFFSTVDRTCVVRAGAFGPSMPARAPLRWHFLQWPAQMFRKIVGYKSSLEKTWKKFHHMSCRSLKKDEVDWNSQKGRIGSWCDGGRFLWSAFSGLKGIQPMAWLACGFYEVIDSRQNKSENIKELLHTSGIDVFLSNFELRWDIKCRWVWSPYHLHCSMLR